MAIGDDALAAGMALTAGTVAANTIDTEINKTRDYIAQRTNAVVPIGSGGTGATTASAARAALGVTAELATKLTKSTTDYNNDFAFRDAQIAARASLGTDVTFGNIFTPGATAASSGWTVAYINSDGRICRGASSLRYKKHVTEVAPSAFGNIFQPLNRFQMRGGDGRWTYGHIAETLAENPDTEQFVMYDAEGRPDSVDYIPLLLAKVEQLNARLEALEGA